MTVSSVLPQGAPARGLSFCPAMASLRAQTLNSPLFAVFLRCGVLRLYFRCDTRRVLRVKNNQEGSMTDQEAYTLLRDLAEILKDDPAVNTEGRRLAEALEAGSVALAAFIRIEQTLTAA